MLVGTDDRRVLKDKNRLETLPPFLDDVAGAAAFTILNGRGVRLPASPNIEYRRGWEVEYDQWCMRVGKALLWAAGKQPAISLTLTPDGKEIVRATLPGEAATLRWQSLAQKLVVDIRLRRDDGQVVYTTQKTLDGAEGELPVNMPSVRCGTYWLDAIARDGDRVAGFASVPLAVVCPGQETHITLDRDWAEVGETVSGKVQIAGGRSDGRQVVVSLVDRRGREIARQKLNAGAAEQSFRFTVEPWVPDAVGSARDGERRCRRIRIGMAVRARGQAASRPVQFRYVGYTPRQPGAGSRGKPGSNRRDGAPGRWLTTAVRCSP